MPTPTAQKLSDPAFVKAMNGLIDNAFMCSTPIMDILKRARPKFSKTREVHAARARKLRRRGEYVHFLRWDQHGHCIYGWSGPAPQTFMLNRMPRKQSQALYTQIEYRTVYALEVPS